MIEFNKDIETIKQIVKRFDEVMTDKVCEFKNQIIF